MIYRLWLLVPILLLSHQLSGQTQSPAAPSTATSTSPAATSTNEASQPTASATRVAAAPRVAVIVDAPEEMKQTIQMYMKKEMLKATHHNPDEKGGEQWQIQIVAFDPDNKKHAERFSMAVAFIQKAPDVDPAILQELEKNRCMPDAKLKSYEKQVTNVDIFESLSAWDGRIGELQKTCQSISEDFVKAILGPAQKGLADGTKKVYPPASPQVGARTPPAVEYQPPPIPALPPH